MKTAIFEYGKQSLSEWIKENSDCTDYEEYKPIIIEY